MPEVEGLLHKTGVILVKQATKPEDVVGFDYVVRHDDTCWEYYAANPPLIGMTRPTEIPCPVGVQIIGAYKIDYKKAIELFMSSLCGGAFTGITLYWPLVPSVTEPQWHIRSVLGADFVVGANDGRGECLSR